MTQVATKVLGIDPGSRKMGWGVIASVGPELRHVASGTVVLDPRLPLAERLGLLLGEVTRLLDVHQVSMLAIEAAFVQDNPRTALVLGQARGIPIALAAARGLPVHEYPPALVKRHVVGSGRADKTQVRQMIRVLLRLPELPAEDEADALAVALAHLRGAAFQGAQALAVVQAQVSLSMPVAVPSARSTAGQAAWLAALQATGGGKAGGRR